MPVVQSSSISKEQALSQELISINTFYNKKLTTSKKQSQIIKLETSRKAAISEAISRYSKIHQ